MEMIGQGKVTGFKWFVGTMDDGKVIDSGTIFIESALKGSDRESTAGGKGYARGYASQPFRCSNSAVVKRVQHIETPFSAQLVIESQTDGRGEKSEIVIDIRPVIDVTNPASRPETGKAASKAA
ncbi:MAG: hypothetical protein LBE33_02445 [Zoogloeaceae bacterium]|jgi:hypothetical protein|nr:hypothetical protein [Zoogloeaceae bacterium]